MSGLELLTTRDVAAILGVSARRVRAIIANRRERGVKVGWRTPMGQWLFRPEEVELLQLDITRRKKEEESDDD